MGLRGLLFALLMGSLALPVAIGLIVANSVSSGIDEGPSRRFSAVRFEVGRAIAPDGSGGLLAKKGYAPPAWLLLVVADREERVVYTNVAGLRAGDKASRMSSLFSQNRYAPPSSLATQKRVPTCVYVETVEQKGRILGTYYALVWPIDASRLDERRNPFFFLLFLLAFALVAVIGAAGISALLARSVMRLERAAGRIASGDLETPVEERGIREISALSLSMDRMRASLLEDKDRRARFLASISHDLRTPLTSIGGYLEAVEDGLASDPAVLAHYVEIMEGKTRILEDRVQSLLDFARMETGEWNIRFASLDLAAFLEELALGFAEEASLRGRRFERELSAIRGARVSADPILLTRVFENLVSNALRYSPEGGLVRLSARFTLTALFVDVDDEGLGVPEPERELVFEPFYRGAGNREGHGLGLYIARTILRGHGWAIEVSESPLGGARFTITIAME
jgi:signal transduction histidine kinase